MNFAESEYVELKREISSNFVKEIIAFANSCGGTIYVGVSDDGTIAGVSDYDKIVLQIENMVRDSVKPDVTMFLKYDKIEENGKQIVAVSVEEGTNRPYYLASKGMRSNGVFVRRGTATEQATDEAIRQMIRDTDGDSYEQECSLQQELTFDSAKYEFKLKNLPFGRPQMQSLGMLKSDGRYTNLGLLLSEQCKHTVKVAFFQDTTQNIFLDRDEYGGSLFDQMMKTYEFLAKHNQLHSSFSGLRRIDQRDYPEVALREALLNCLVHRDYARSSSTLVSVYEDRIEFTNIGSLPSGLSIEEAMIGYSECRNPKLANVFYRLEFVEAYGTGLRKIMGAYEGSRFQPRFDITEHIFRLVLPNRNYEAERPAGYGVSDVSAAYGTRKDFFSRADLQKQLGVSQATANRIIRRQLQAGELEAYGQGRNTKYRIVQGK